MLLIFFVAAVSMIALDYPEFNLHMVCQFINIFLVHFLFSPLVTNN